MIWKKIQVAFCRWLCKNFGVSICNECSNPVAGSCDCPSSVPTPGPRGEPGPKGDTGSPGVNGVNAYTNMTAQATQPAVGANVPLTVASTAWMVVGQTLYIQSAGYMQVVSLNSLTSVTVKNLGASGNASPTTIIPNASKISPAGSQGPELVSPLPIAQGGTGQSNAINGFDSLAPTTNNGDIITRTSGSNNRLGIGTSGQVLTVVAGVPAWAENTLAAGSITGQVAIANGGTGASTDSGARTNLGVPGLATANILTENNFFQLPASTGQFKVTDDTGTVSYYAINRASSSISQSDLAGNVYMSIGSTFRFLTGFRFPIVSYELAAAPTYNSWLLGRSTIVCMYSSLGTQTITLPAGVDGRVVVVKDGDGNAGTNNITINRSGSNVFEGGGTSYVISTNYGSVKFMFIASTGVWAVMP